jgi:mannose-1-phosphate guanylyltransferase
MSSQTTIDGLGGIERTAPSQGQLWGIVLAGGEGVRLRPLAQRVCGDDRPKQYVPLFGDRTLLRQTLDRVALGIPPNRTAVVTLRSHARYCVEQFSGSRRPRPHVLVQPVDRGTTAGILFPAHWVSWRDPDATVAVFPSDHFVLQEGTFMRHVADVAAWVNHHPDRLVLLGVQPTGPEVEYGWIELGRPLDSTRDCRISEIRRFWEKPSEEKARICLAAGCLWNTLVLIGKASTFVRAGQQSVPEVNDRLSRIAPFLGSDDEAWAIHQAYAPLPKGSFSRSILEPCPSFLAVSDLPQVTWSDLGSPRRVFDILKRAPRLPSWVLASDLAAS